MTRKQEGRIPAYTPADWHGLQVPMSDELWRSPRHEELLRPEGLRKALDHGEFVAWYQPLYDLRYGELRGVEALARWDHPVLGLLAPEIFLEALRAHGLLSELTILMTWHAASAAKRWERDGQVLPIAINAEWRCLESGRLQVALRSACRNYGIPVSRLHIEISEQTAIEDRVAAQLGVRTLQAAGVCVALDDFGAGNTSLQLLRDIECDRVKLDRSLVKGVSRDHRAAALLGGLIGMIRALGVQVLAEGVEDPSDQECLIELGCDMAQGYLYCPPMAEDDMVRRCFHIGRPIMKADGTHRAKA